MIDAFIRPTVLWWLRRPDDSSHSDEMKMDQPLDEIAVRVLGSLLEKELTTPDNYPLTLNALTAACNQSSSRDPVMNLDEGEVRQGLERLADRKLARGIHRGDARVMRYREEIGERLHLHRPELAVLSVLMLRGPQTPGEIKTRTARAVDFVDPSHVEITLEALAGMEPPLVTALPRRPGQKEVRYAHLLAGAPPEDAGDSDATSAAPRRSAAPGRVDELEEKVDGLSTEVADLREEVSRLRDELEAFRRQFE